MACNKYYTYSNALTVQFAYFNHFYIVHSDDWQCVILYGSCGAYNRVSCHLSSSTTIVSIVVFLFQMLVIKLKSRIYYDTQKNKNWNLMFIVSWQCLLIYNFVESVHFVFSIILSSKWIIWTSFIAWNLFCSALHMRLIHGWAHLHVDRFSCVFILKKIFLFCNDDLSWQLFKLQKLWDWHQSHSEVDQLSRLLLF